MKKTHCKNGHERSPENVYKGGVCKECKKARTAKYRLEHLEEAKARSAKWRLEHPEYAAKYRLENLEEAKASSAKWRLEHPENRMFFMAKQRAKKQNVPCTITEGDIYIPINCPVFGFPLVRNIGSNGPVFNSPSLDKIIPSIGYVPGNIQVISHLANTMKSYSTPEQQVLFAQWILRQKTAQDV